MPYVKSPTWIQRAPDPRRLGLGDTTDFCAPGFVGPLSPDQATICNLEAGINYRDTLLSAPAPAAPGIAAWLAANQSTVLLVGAGLLGLALIKGLRS